MEIPLFKTHWMENNIKAVEVVIRRGTHWAVGPEIEQFEKKLVVFTGRKYALTFNSGTSALVALYSAVGVHGKEVIVPSFTFIATANAVLLAGGIPVFAESEEETLGLDAADVARKITPNTKAIVALNYAGGVSRDIEKLQQLAAEKGVFLLEDNAHSLGVYKNGKQCGTFGVGAALSFCQNKLITTGEGGAVITDSQELYEKMKLLRSHGRVENSDGDYFSSTKEHDYLEVGHNFRMPTMNAALGLSQLEHFEQTVKLRKESGDALSAGLQQIKGVKVPLVYQNSDHFYQMYTITVENKTIRDALQKYLNEKGIMCRVYYDPVHLKSLYRQNFGCREGDLPQTEELSRRILTLPMYPGMSTEEINYIVSSVTEFFQNLNQGSKQ
ncbi:MAG: DegT/DnrJ/EryC1/StrS family aminotransferase [Nanoarchaeota archaeon]|nr:DegT/DnrJ/EryC1/StrS family aminotransferase [Nanoarchaeota archaeon]